MEQGNNLTQNPQQTTVPPQTTASGSHNARFQTYLVEAKGIFHNKIVVRALLGLLIAAGLGFLIYFLLSGGFTQAGSYQPTNVAIQSVTEGSAVITWETPVETQGVVEYGTTPTALNFFAPETEKTKKHKVELTLLSPGTTYYFQIRINDKVYDNGGVPWTFTTKEKGGKTNVTPVISPASSPTPTPVQSESPTPTPTPYESFEVENTEKSCDYDSCDEIKANLGKGCSLKDYLLCKAQSENKEETTPTPTSEATSEATESPTPTPEENNNSTPTPTPTPEEQGV